MNAIGKLIKVTVSVLIFCGGLYALISETRTYDGLIQLTRNQFKEDVLYQQQNFINKMTISYAELIASMLLPLEYNIKIDDFIIQKENHDQDKISGYPIKKSYYRKTYEYDEEGSISFIIYTSTS